MPGTESEPAAGDRWRVVSVGSGAVPDTCVSLFHVREQETHRFFACFSCLSQGRLALEQKSELEKASLGEAEAEQGWLWQRALSAGAGLGES